MADDPWAVVSTTPVQSDNSDSTQQTAAIAPTPLPQTSPTNDPWAVSSVAPIQSQTDAMLGQQQSPSPVASVTPQGDPNGTGSTRFSGFGQGVRDMGNAVIQRVATHAPDDVVQWLGHNYPHDIGPSETSDYHYKPEDILTMIRNQGSEYGANKNASDRKDSWDIPRLGGNAAALGTGMAELGPIAAGAVSGALQPNYNAKDSTDVDVGALESGASGAALGYGLNKVANFLSPKVNTAIKYFTDRGVYPTAGQISQMSDTWIGKLPAAIEEGYSRLPFIGGFVNRARNASIEDMNKMAYDDALAPINRSVDPKAAVGQDGLQDVASKIDTAYEEAKKKLTFKADQDYIDNVADINARLYGDVSHLEKPDGTLVANPDAGMGAFDKPLRDLYHRVTGSFSQAAGDTSNAMDGATLVRAQSVLKTNIQRLSKGNANDQAMADLLKEFNGNVNAALQRTNTPRDLADLANAHKSYQLYQRLVDASTAAKNNGFVFTPNQYMNSIARWSGKDQLARGQAVNQDFAEAASDLFKNTIRDSGTPSGNEFRYLLHSLAKTGTANTAAGAVGLTHPLVGVPAFLAPLATHNDLARKLIAKTVAGDRPIGSEQMSELFKAAAPYVSGPAGNSMLGNDTPETQKTNQLFNNGAQ